MPNRTILWIINLILFILGLVLAYRGWQATRHTRILIEWTTASELDTVGYNLYRSEDPAIMGARVNPELIPASSDPLTGGSYEFEDRDVQAGVSYYYSLEEVESSGATHRAGVIEVTAKPDGWWQIGLAVLLFGVVIVGAFNLVEAYRIKTS
jgi:hypothetical protein